MIVYEPNKNWFRDIGNLAKSWTMQKILRGVLLIGVVATAICIIMYRYGFMPHLHSGIFSLLGIVLSIVLVFRTNTAYDRWWEGRKQWGSLVNNTRTLATLLHACLPATDKENRFYFARHISNFAIALKEHLRKGVKMDELVHLQAEEIESLNRKQHKPNYIALLIYNKIRVVYGAGALTDADLINIKPQCEALIDILGACERIKKTPIPFSYSVYIKIFISLYGLILPFGLFSDFGFYAIPLTMFIFFAMLGIELMAEEIEDPFGLDCNDLPTGDIALTIKKNVFEILEQEVVKEPAAVEIYTKVF
ncbi:bestrophin family ion channel [Chryseolinea sp. H1M3-3]|uniref:bestrophin family protein n=1 Tax=Chryseolinea sp. H1M3-3 TaxID=3034144 RepID=UPI0023EAC7A4|nr:bestrophin family ion channel [Chryseolinea sp. H1M3-3]